MKELVREAEHNQKEGRRYFDQTLQAIGKTAKDLIERYHLLQRRILTDSNSAQARIALSKSLGGRLLLKAFGV